ncbi:hypothetical protein [Cupriavidus sp. CuC1]|uniref:hypothetical protein n=1 Tax=Cupriavidus sp. CuC1 TaxID=3373131 RepID=UPI0037D0759E
MDEIVDLPFEAIGDPLTDKLSLSIGGKSFYNRSLPLGMGLHVFNNVVPGT